MTPTLKRPLILASILLFTLGMLFVISACSSDSNTNTKTGSEQTSDPRVTYEGKILYVSLEENNTTGYAWEFDIDGSALVAKEDEFVLDKETGGEEPKVGVGGTHTFLFEGVNEGTSTVNLRYLRSWEPQEADEKLLIVVGTTSDGTIENVTVNSA